MLSETAETAVTTMLQKERRLLYPVIDTDLQNYILYKNTKYRTTPDTILSSTPRRVYVFFIRTENFTGSITTNPCMLMTIVST